MVLVGIDIGTSSCSVSAMIDGRPQVLPLFNGRDEMPTYVAFTVSGDRLVGWPAKRQAVLNPSDTIYTIKRLIGRKYADEATQEELGLLPYRVRASATGGLWVEAGGRFYSPIEITAIMLGEVRDAAARFFDDDRIRAVITAPAYFDEAQREATRRAAELAGIEVVRIVAEPTAAALAYGYGRNANERVAVYDLGGGTFDVSLLDFGEGVFEVLSVNGDNRLGGEDFDHRIVAHFVDRIRTDHGTDLRDDTQALHRLKEGAEQLKIDLDSMQHATLPLASLFRNGDAWVNVELQLSRNEFERMVVDLIERTLAPCEAAMRDAGQRGQRGSLTGVVLVGGMSRMPAIRRRVTELFGVEPRRQLDPCRVVALGAAVQAGVLAGNVHDTLLLDVIPFALGFLAGDGRPLTIIERNTSIPTGCSINLPFDRNKFEKQYHKKYGTRPTPKMAEAAADAAADFVVEAWCEAGLVRIVQVIDGPKQHFLTIHEQTTDAFRGILQPKVEFSLDVDANHRLSFQIRETTTGRSLDGQVDLGKAFPGPGQLPGRSRSADDLAIIRAREQANELLDDAERALVDPLVAVPAELRLAIGAAADEMRRAMQSRDHQELQAAIDAFCAVTHSPAPLPKSAPMPEPTQIRAVGRRSSVFVSYSHADARWFDRLRTHLAPLERSGLVEVWHDLQIKTGDAWRTAIDAALTRASIAVLLVSADFMASTFIYDYELPPILRGKERSALRVYPVYIGHCLHRRDPFLSKLQGFNDPERPLSCLDETDVEAAFANLSEQIWTAVQGNDQRR